MRFTRTLSHCERCPLRDQRRIWSKGPEDPTIVFIGEAPGQEEVENNEPFVGPAGRYFSWGLKQTNILRHRQHVTNVLCCKLPRNDWNSLEAQEARDCCREGFKEELRWLKEHNVKVIAPLGANPLHALGISGNITSLRGSVFETEYGLVIPTFHPSYLNRMQWDRNGAKASMKYVWLADLKKIRRISYDTEYRKPEEHFVLSPSYEDIHDFVTRARREHTPIGVDIETTSLDPSRGEIIVIGLARDGSHAISVPLLTRHGVPRWTSSEESRVRSLVTSLFKDNDLIFQNSLFDVRHLRRHGFEIPWNNIAHDTLLLHHAVSPELPHNLGFIVSVYGSTPYWKAPEEYEEYDNKLVVNLRDSVVLHQITSPMVGDLVEMGTDRVYHEESLRLIKPVIKMMDNGILLNKNKLAAWKGSLKRDLGALEGSLKKLGSLPGVFNLSSDDDLRLFLFGTVANKFRRAAVEIKKKKRTDTKVYRELTATLEIQTETQQLWSNSSGKRTTSTGRIAVDKQGLLSLQLSAQNRLEYLKTLKKRTKDHDKEATQIQTLLAWLSDFYRYRELEKLCSTYTSYAVGADNRVHTQFLIHGTATGRLSSSSPNLQNLPEAARKTFVASNGSVFLEADYDNLEVRVLAHESNDEPLFKMLENGTNIHDANTKTLFGLKKGDLNFDLARRAAKIFQFGRIQYGGSDRQIYEQIVLAAPGLGLTFAAFKQALKRWFAEHPAILAYQEALRRHIREHRSVVSAFGRVRVLMASSLRDAEKEGLNFPIQSSAASIINKAMIKLDDEMERVSPDSKLILQVHDSLLFEVPKEDLKVMKTLVKETMEDEVDFRGTKVSFPVTLKEGPSWGELK